MTDSLFFRLCRHNHIMRALTPSPCQSLKEILDKTSQYDIIYTHCEKCSKYEQVKL
jgi:uncharacterized OB-fold protein